MQVSYGRKPTPFDPERTFARLSRTLALTSTRRPCGYELIASGKQ